ncbi:MAG: hypothetical protein IKQ61_00505 [Spirochaetales bacterium]|nr:hypothetical protein [Spirochaetales bacterium]
MTNSLTFDTLMNMERDITLAFNQQPWPSESLDEIVNSAIESIRRFCGDSYDDYTNLSSDKIQQLQKMLDVFFADNHHNIKLITGGNRRNICRILYNQEKLYVNNIKLSDKANIENLILLINATDKTLHPLIAKVVMMLYLNIGFTNEQFRLCVQNVYSDIDKENKSYIHNIDLYLNSDKLISILNSVSPGEYHRTLEAIGIRREFIECRYFRKMFFDWLFTITQNYISVLKTNVDLIRKCTLDELKLLFAKAIMSLYDSGKFFTETDINNIDSMINQNDDTDKSDENYWKITNISLNTNANRELLKNAYRIIKALFSQLLLNTFFDFLGEGSSISRERSEFWRPYCFSAQLINIKLCLNNSQRRLVHKKLSWKNWQIFIKNHLIENDSDGINESPVLLLVFTTKTIAEFTLVGNATQVYDTNNPKIHRLVNSNHIYSAKDFKFYGQEDSLAFYSADGVGRIIHNGDWMYMTSSFLQRNHILPGNIR